MNNRADGNRPGPQPSPVTDTQHAGDVVPFREALRAWFLISLQTFGGPAGQIAALRCTLAGRSAKVCSEIRNGARQRLSKRPPASPACCVLNLLRAWPIAVCYGSPSESESWPKVFVQSCQHDVAATARVCSSSPVIEQLLE